MVFVVFVFVMEWLGIFVVLFFNVVFGVFGMVGFVFVGCSVKFFD